MSSTRPDTLKTSRLMLSQEQIDDYMAEGYLRLETILDLGQIAYFRNEYDREIERARHGNYISNLAEDEQTKTNNTQMLEVSRVSTHNVQFAKLVHADRILDAVEDLIGPNIRLLEAVLLYKPPHHGSVYWHQDNLHHQCFPANMVSGWLTLDDVDRDNGAMEMIPKSHLRPS
jgi:ectoine hydroxylase-related dioxygenase (phytanoyl-CoA dioxygenase family)